MGTIVCPTVINQKHSDALPKQYKDLAAEPAQAGPRCDRQRVQEIGRGERGEVEEARHDAHQGARRAAGTVSENRRTPDLDEWVAENKAEFDAQGLLDLVLASAGAAK
jgi:hypothetical protein